MRRRAAELPVIHEEHRGQAQQRLGCQEVDLAPGQDRLAPRQVPELLLRLSSRQIQVTTQIGHVARLLRHTCYA